MRRRIPLPFLILPALLVLVPFMTLAAPDGGKLYQQHCSACHGLQGNGGVGVPLALESFQKSVDNDFFFKSIRNGRPGRVMPTFSGLSDSQISAIIKHLRSWVPGSEDEGHYRKLGRVEGDPTRGAALFAHSCAVCHGEKGEGGHGTGVTFSRPRDQAIMAPALNNIGYLKSASDQVIKGTILHGREGTPMPPFSKLLDNQQVDDVVAFIRDFEKEIHVWKPVPVTTGVIEMESESSYEETIENLKRAAIGQNFRIIRQQNYEDGAFPKEEQKQKQVIIYFCNFKFVNRAINIDPRVGLFLPCRVTVVEKDGVVTVRSINPGFLSRFFNNAELDEACAELTNIYRTIIEEATL
ncbi:MAG: c-type cytochrome [Sedimenticola sp.]